MALSNATVWEVRGAGNDNNGGGFVAGGTGTDYSQQNAAQYTFSDLASTNGTNASPQVTSASHSFVSTDKDNILHVTAGTNWTPGFYQIVSVSGGAATLDKACGTSATLSAGTYAVGGALATPGMAGAAHVARNTIWIKNVTYTLTTATANVAGGTLKPAAGSGSASGYTRVRGYNTARWSESTGPTASDIANRPTIVNGAISTVTILDATNGGIEALCLILDGNSQTSTVGLEHNGGFNSIFGYITGRNCSTVGIRLGSQAILFDSEATGCTSAASGGIILQSGATSARNCWSHGNACPGFVVNSAGLYLIRCIGSGNTGASGKGFSFGTADSQPINCVAQGNAQAGFEWASGSGFIGPLADSCIAYGNTGIGFNATGGLTNAALRNCAGGSNSGGNVSSNITRQWGFVSLSGDPFTNAASGDFSLNNTAGAGAACRAAGLPGLFIGGLSTGYLDIGAMQHQDPAGASIYTRAPIVRGL